MGKAKKTHREFPESKSIGAKGLPRPLRQQPMPTIKEAREKAKTKAKAKNVAK